MHVDEVIDQESRPEVEDLLPEVREIQRRRRRRLVVLVTLCLTVALIAAAAIFGAGAAGVGPARGLFSEPAVWIPTTTNGVTTWGDVGFSGISCPAIGDCIAIGERSQGTREQAVFVRQRGATWSRPVPAGPWQSGVFEGFTLSVPEPLACSTTSSCVSSTNASGALSLISEAQDRWIQQRRYPLGFAGPAQPSACSPGGACWTLVQQQLNSIVTYAVGEDDGRWLTPYRLGGPDLKIVGHQPFIVSSRFISCGSSTTCTVAVRASATRLLETFLQTEEHGRWGPISIVPTSVVSPASKRTLRFFSVSELPIGPALDCPSPTTCLLGGFVTDAQDVVESGSVEQEVDGRWLPVVTGLGVAGSYVSSRVTSIACHTASLCIAGGETDSANGKLVASFAQAEVRGRWLRPLIMPNLGGRGSVGIWRTGAACSSSTCVFYAELTGSSSWNASVVATYVEGKWRYSLAKVDGSSLGLDVTGVSCAADECWIVGTSPDHTGFVSPVPG